MVFSATADEEDVSSAFRLLAPSTWGAAISFLLVSFDVVGLVFELVFELDFELVFELVFESVFGVFFVEDAFGVASSVINICFFAELLFRVVFCAKLLFDDRGVFPVLLSDGVFIASDRVFFSVLLADGVFFAEPFFEASFFGAPRDGTE